MKTLVYVGAHQGFSLSRICYDYERVFAFEPDPITFNILKENLGHIPWIHMVNAACSDKEGEATFYLFNSRQSSSLSDANPELSERTKLRTTVRTINLYDFLMANGVDYIDMYVSDVQGADLSVLKTIEPFVRDKRIKMMEMETHWDGARIYEDFDNRLSSFREFLEPDYYPAYAYLGGPARHEYSEIDAIDHAAELEWDTIWLPSA